MDHVILRGKRNPVYTVKYDLPKDVHVHFGKTAIWKSLGTDIKADAIERAAPIIAEIERRVAQARQSSAPSAPPPVQPALSRLTPDAAHAAIKRWVRQTVDAAYVDAFNGQLAPVADPVAHSDMLYDLQQGREPQGLTAMLAEVLGVPLNHPALDQRHVRQWLREGWLDAERHIERFRRGDFGEWSSKPPKPPSAASQKPAKSQASSIALKPLLDRFLTSQVPAEASDIKAVWRRLEEFYGDGDVGAHTITHLMADDFAIAVRSFPLTKKPDVLAKPMKVIIAEHGSEKTLSPKSVWKWLGHVNRVFKWAVAKKLLDENPFATAMPKKPGKDQRTKDRRIYTPAEIAKMFSAPLFTGFSGNGATGYREAPGATVLKDEKFWLPTFALWHGCRLEEIGGAKVSELVEEDGVAFFDWTKRKLKTPEASRELPIHPKMVELGWNDYVAERRAAGDTYLFPSLPHDESVEDPEASTRRYSKWWARWMDANGFPDPDLDFHALRHTFKRACRGAMDEELHDLITGHVGKGGVGRDYGGGAPIRVLCDALTKVTYPTFKLSK